MKVVIIGGGISGLALAWALRRREIRATVLEAAPRVGGKIGTRHEAGFIVEDGPNTFLDKEPALRECLRSLGIERHLVSATAEAKKRFVYQNGKLCRLPSSPPAFLKSELLSTRAKLRVFGDLFAARGPDEDESLAAFARRRIGPEATRVLVDAFQRGIFAGDVEKLSVRAALPKLHELEQEHRSLILGAIRSRPAAPTPGAPTGVLSTLQGGLEVMIDALAEALRDSIRTDSQVEAVEAREGGGWRLRIKRLEELSTLEADVLISCAPADVSARLLAGVDPRLSEQLEGIRYAPVGVVQLGFAAGAVPAPEGFGFLVPSSEGRAMIGAIHTSTVFPWRAPEGGVLITCLLGGMTSGSVVENGGEELIALARKELGELAGITATPTFTRAVRWPRAIPQYELGHLERVKKLDEALTRWPNLYLSGNALRGPGVPDCVREAELLAERISVEVARVAEAA